MKPLVIFAAALILSSAASARADMYTFVLDNDGRVTGEWLNRNESPRKTYVVKTASGATITLGSGQVKQFIPRSAAELEYERIRPSFADTIEAQWELAEWCREQSLIKHREVHLNRILELDSDHKQARAALGYSMVDGRWMTQEQVMTSRGYVRYGGSWKLPQEVELLERAKKNERAADEWKRTMMRHREALVEGGQRARQAQEAILSISDPAAVPALADALGSDRLRPLKILYIKALTNIGTPDAWAVLVECSLSDPDEEVRLTCFDQMEDTKNPRAVALYVQNLKHKDNIRVNWAARGLAVLKDPSTVNPLIQALVTTHKFKVGSGSPGQMTTGFGSDGSGGLAMNNSGPKIVRTAVPNQAVLDALVELTGQNFDFNVKAWKYWYAAQKKIPQDFDFRRG